MSFIYGIINLDHKPVVAKEISLLAAAVKWDGFQEYNIIAENYAWGYCHHPERESKAGFFEYDNIIILADIHIYNTEALQQQFSFKSPEEAFAKAYLKWGIDCGNYINGDFAVVVIDKKKKEVHLVRDHIGARPLTYSFANNQLIFASHEFGLAKSKLITTALSEEKLIIDFFKNKSNYAQTAFENILKLKPGYCLTIAANQVKDTKYWKPENIKKNKTLSLEDAVLQLRKLLIEATIQRVETGKTGVHVSGGIDSTGIASILADSIADKSKLIGYSWTPEQQEGKFEGIDEKEFIEKFSLDKKVTIKYGKLAANEFSKDYIIPEFEDMPIEHPTMKMAAKDEVTTLFSGWGGDEFVSLSNRGTYNHLFFSFKWKTLSILILRRGIKSSVRQFRIDILPLVVPFDLLPIYAFKDWSALHYLQFSFIRKHWRKIFFNREKNIFGWGNRTQFMLNLLYRYHIPNRTDSWSLHSERYGFTYKYPLLDKAVLEFWFSLPIEYTYRNMPSRFLYREAMKGILIEKVRVRNDKEEGRRISDSLQRIDKETPLLQNLFLSLEDKDQLPFFKHDLVKKTFTETKKARINNPDLRIHLYLRYVALKKKYLS
jgi:asparagine synthase (glutamine-hydrolysing)